jgi:hypothetical protein
MVLVVKLDIGKPRLFEAFIFTDMTWTYVLILILGGAWDGCQMV